MNGNYAYGLFYDILCLMLLEYGFLTPKLILSNPNVSQTAWGQTNKSILLTYIDTAYVLRITKQILTYMIM